MADEAPADALIPEPVSIPTPKPISEPIQPKVETPAPPEPQTAQIPASEPLEPVPAVDPVVASPPPEPVQQQSEAQVSVVAPIIHLARDLAVKARAVIQGRKRKKLDKILETVAKHGSITNNQVEKLLHVSDATATRYLTQLEKEGKIKQEGKTGKSVKYLKI